VFVKWVGWKLEVFLYSPNWLSESEKLGKKRAESEWEPDERKVGVEELNSE